MKANIIVNYVVFALSAATAGLNTLPYGWAHVACIAISSTIGFATGASGTILTVRAIRGSNG